MVSSSQDQAAPSRLAHYSKLAIILAIIVLLNLFGSWLGHVVNFQLFPRHDSMLHTVLLIAAATYILLMAIPFMPGIEIGLAIMMILGSKGALLVYLCTLIALSISYAVGMLIPLRVVYRFLKWLHLIRASELVRKLEHLDQQGRLKFLSEKAPRKFAPFLLNHRYATIAVVLNLPGNALIGGGGGIGLIVGMSSIIPFHKYFLILACAVAPIPLWFYLGQGV